MKKKPLEPAQPEKFKAMAKEVEADGDEKTYDRTLKYIAKSEPKAKQKKEQ